MDRAPSAVLLHGIASDSRTWRGVAGRLADRGWSVTALDLPGHGGRPAHGVVTADGLQRSVLAARANPAELARTLERDHPAWSRHEALDTTAARARLDLDRALTLLRRRADWDLPGLVAACPVPVCLIATQGADSALVDPDRDLLLRRLTADRVSLVAAGHSVHLDAPDAWVRAVATYASAVLGVEDRPPDHGSGRRY